MPNENTAVAAAAFSNHAPAHRRSASESSESSAKFETSSLSAAIFEAGDRAASAPPPPVPRLPFASSNSVSNSTSTIPTVTPIPSSAPPPPPASDLTPITPNLYVTSLSGASNAMSVSRENITHVLSLTATKPHLPSLPPPAVDPLHHHIPLEDSPSAPLLALLPEITEWIHSALYGSDTDDPRVLVHCEFGISRAPAVVIGYLMATKGMSFREGIRMVQEKRGNVCLNLGFIRALSKWAEVKGDLWVDGTPISPPEKNKEKEKPEEDAVVELPNLRLMTNVDPGGSMRVKRMLRPMQPERLTPHEAKTEDAEDGRTSKTGTLHKMERTASVILLEKKQEWEAMKKKKGWKKFRCW